MRVARLGTRNLGLEQLPHHLGRALVRIVPDVQLLRGQQVARLDQLGRRLDRGWRGPVADHQEQAVRQPAQHAHLVQERGARVLVLSHDLAVQQARLALDAIGLVGERGRRRRIGLLHTHEVEVEHPRQILRGNAAAIVPNLEFNARGLLHSSCADPQIPAAWHGIHGVHHQRQQNLLDLRRIATDARKVSLRIELQLNSSQLQFVLYQAD